jgi:hypothetical protein
MAKSKGKKAAKAKSVPGHYTEKGTRKFQSNGPIEWSKVFKAAARAAGEEKEGKGIALAMAFAIANEKAFLKYASTPAKIEVKAEEK